MIIVVLVMVHVNILLETYLFKNSITLFLKLCCNHHGCEVLSYILTKITANNENIDAIFFSIMMMIMMMTMMRVLAMVMIC